MRTRRLLGLAVLAVALGFATATRADVGVVTVIANPGDVADTWEVRVRLWGDDGVGSTPEGLGLLDFVLYGVSGTGGAAVTGSVNVAPEGTWDPNDGHGLIETGFADIRTDGITGAGILGMQPVSYADDGMNDPVMDQAVLLGVGIADGTWEPPPGTTGDTLGWEKDTKVAEGTWTGPGGLAVRTFGNVSFSVLPDPDTNGAYEGPTNDFGPWVTCVVTQSTAVQGNDGGETVAQQPTLLSVEEGTFVMGQNMGQPATAGTPAVANVSVVLKDPNTGIQLAGDQDLAGLAVDFAQAGLQGLDLNSPPASGAAHVVRMYPGDAAARAAQEQAIMAMLANGATTGDGIYDSGLHADSAIGVTDNAQDLNGDLCVILRATRIGDATCDTTVDLSDLQAVRDNWTAGGATWDQGNFNYLVDDVVDLSDLQAVRDNWTKDYTPEPATLGLLALGGVLMVWRRRRTR